MNLIFPSDRKSECVVLKETKKYIVFRCKSNKMKYRYDKDKNIVQDGTYHNALKGLSIEL